MTYYNSLLESLGVDIDREPHYIMYIYINCILNYIIIYNITYIIYTHIPLFSEHRTSYFW